MKKKELIIANFLVLLLMGVSGILTFNTFSNAPFQFSTEAAKEIILPEQEQTLPTSKQLPSNCTSKKPLKLSAGNDRHLLQLQKYQDMCNSYVTNKLMIFTTFPYNNISAIEDSTFMANKLKKFKEQGISPIVIIEPYVGDKAMNYRDFLSGNYDWTLDLYFSHLKQAGVTDEMMGMWVPFPESNTPNWDNKDTEPKDFALCINRYFSLLKRTFPSAKAGILLNATTYDPNDTEWNNGDYLSLIPYLQDIQPNLVDSFGIQGFPWVSAATMKKKTIFRASEFLQPDLIIDAAKELRVKDIWINTGSFAKKYANDPKKMVQVSLDERRAILNGILEEANKIQNIQLNEYRVSINLFSEDKSSFQEATDWSYFQDEDSKSILREFLTNAEKNDLPISLYDVAHVVGKTPQETTPPIRPTIKPNVINNFQSQLFPTKTPLRNASASATPAYQEPNSEEK